jgi:hypothetical protein
MATVPEFVNENQVWNERLTALVGRLTDEDLQKPMEAGWTVAAVLAHLAFWDIRLVTLLEKFRRERNVAESEVDSDLINEVSRHLCLEIPPRKAAELALTWAKKADDAIAVLHPALISEIQEKAPTVRLDRGHHRIAHITDIEKALKG